MFYINKVSDQTFGLRLTSQTLVSAKDKVTHCRLGLLPAAQNFLASIRPLIEILRSLVLDGDPDSLREG